MKKEFEIIVNYDNIHIVDSYEARKREFDAILDSLEDEFPFVLVWHRSRFSLYCEWMVHNFLYRIGVQRERTKDVDLNYPCDKPEWMYMLLGILVFPFVK